MFCSVKKPATVGVIGGQGQFGVWMRELFERHGLSPFISDLTTDLSNQELAALSDIVVVSVPIGVTEAVLREIVPHLSSDKLLVDLTSVKSPFQELLGEMPCEVLSLHPMFSPRIKSPLGQSCVACSIKEGPLSSFVLSLLQHEGIVVTELSVEEHDRAMAIVQGITHFQAITAGHAMMALGVDVGKTLKVASPVYEVRFSMIGRILAQDPKLYAEIQIYNPYVPEVLNQLQASHDCFEGYVAARDVDGFVGELRRSREALASFVEEALHQSDQLLLQQNNQKNKGP